MNYLIKIGLLIWIVLASFANLMAQQSSFALDHTEGCGALVVHFTNTSTYQGEVVFNWNFGNGSQSADEHPSISYTSAGTYTITLVVTDDHGSSTSSHQVVVHPFPTVNFNSPIHSGCEPLNVNFHDQSHVADAAITTWEWNFGDGTISNTQNPSHNYTHAGSYTVILEIQDALGCENHITVGDYVQVSQPPIPSFSANPSQYCEPVNVSFTNTSTTIAPPYSSSWNFGDGSSSNQTNPTHYFQAGNHQVTLLVTDAYGCSASCSNYVSITNLNPEILTSETTICQGESITFTNSEMVSSQWNFGDGTGNQFGSVIDHVFTTSGQFVVELTSGSGLCIDHKTKNINVLPQPVASMSFNDTICHPETVNIINTSAYPNAEWSIYQNSVVWYNQISSSTGSQTSVNADSDYNYIILMTITDAHGCSTTLKDTIRTLFLEDLSIEALSDTKCIPFSATINSIFDGDDPIVTYEWTLDDVFLSNNANISNYTFDEVGSYTFELKITTEHGCEFITSAVVLAGDILNVQFTVEEDSVCIGELIHGVDLTETNGAEVEFSWYYDDWFLDGDSILSAPVLDTVGDLTITHTVNYNGCISYNNTNIFVKGPFIDFLTDTFTCSNLLDRFFTAGAIYAQNLIWDFGDGQIQETTNNQISHTYPGNGVYQMTCTAQNDTMGCPDYVVELPVSILNPILIINYEDTTCSHVHINIEQHSLIEKIFLYFDNESIQTNWYLAPFTSTSYDWDYSFTTSGLHYIKIVTEDINGCLDTTLYPVFVPTIVPDFASDSYEICEGDTVHLHQNSTSDNRIDHIYWYISGLSSFTCDPDSVLSIVFSTPGIKTVIITVYDSLGCQKSSSSKYINVHDMPADVSIQDPTLCLGTPANMVVTGNSSNIQITYNYGDGTATNMNSTHYYPDTGSYNINVHMVDQIGCEKDYNFNGVTVQKAIADITLLEDTLHCNPETPVFVRPNTPLPNYYEYTWTDDIGHLSFVPDPIFVYPERGVYHIQYQVSTPNGCTATKYLNLFIDSPDADITLSDDIICINDTVEFRMINDTNIVSYEWTLGDGYGLANVDSVQHAFRFVPDNEQFEVVLTYPAIGCDADGDGEDDEYNTIEYINIFPVEARFETINQLTGIRDTNVCLPFNGLFTNHSLGNGNFYRWLIDGNEMSTQTNFNQLINQISGLIDTINVALMLTSQEGCKDTTNQLVILRSVPPITVSDEKFICWNDSVSLNSSGGSSVLWSSKESINHPNDYQITVRPDSSNFFIATIFESNGCLNKDSVWVEVQQIPQLNSSMNDTIVIVGSEFDIAISSNQSYLNYQWSPPEGLSCTDCPNPDIVITKPTEYKIVISDSANCHEVSKTIFIDVVYDYTIDVPNTFTPNGDGYNDLVYVRGWGLKDLIEFRIYNRWGEEVFFSDDLKVGWDGTKNSVQQNMDSYGFIAKALTYGNEVLVKKGTITLLR